MLCPRCEQGDIFKFRVVDSEKIYALVRSVRPRGSSVKILELSPSLIMKVIWKT